MKVILTQEVSNLGSPGDIVDVADGYGRNYLVPQSLAILATRGAEKQIATIKRAREVREVRDAGHARELASTLSSLTVTLPVRAGDGGKLFGSVTTADVVAAVSKAGGPKIDKRRVVLTTPIKTLGSHKISVKIHAEVDATVTLEVVAAK